MMKNRREETYPRLKSMDHLIPIRIGSRVLQLFDLRINESPHKWYIKEGITMTVTQTELPIYHRKHTRQSISALPTNCKHVPCYLAPTLEETSSSKKKGDKKRAFLNKREQRTG
jgi:hypothetical protein